jgi:hypothetical protein
MHCGFRAHSIVPGKLLLDAQRRERQSIGEHLKHFKKSWLTQHRTTPLRSAQIQTAAPGLKAAFRASWRKLRINLEGEKKIGVGLTLSASGIL